MWNKAKVEKYSISPCTVINYEITDARLTYRVRCLFTPQLITMCLHMEWARGGHFPHLEML